MGRPGFSPDPRPRHFRKRIIRIYPPGLLKILKRFRLLHFPQNGRIMHYNTLSRRPKLKKNKQFWGAPSHSMWRSPIPNPESHAYGTSFLCLGSYHAPAKGPPTSTNLRSQVHMWSRVGISHRSEDQRQRDNNTTRYVKQRTRRHSTLGPPASVLASLGTNERRPGCFAWSVNPLADSVDLNTVSTAATSRWCFTRKFTSPVEVHDWVRLPSVITPFTGWSLVV